MLKKKRLCTALALVYAGGLSLMAPAMAQESLERVSVTGSSIKRLDSETALPVTVVTRAQIEASGATNTEELLKRISANSAMLSDTGQGTGYGTSNANLRGMGANSTLVLLNGRRLANHPFGSIGGAASVDLNSIPFAAIEKIEVLRDGASAVYGSDAVAGVVNFITRKDYRNGEVSVRYGNTEAGIGGAEKGATLAVGFGDIASNGFNVLLTANVQKNTRLRAIDQGFYNRGVDEVPGSDKPSSSAPFPGYIEGLIGPGAYPEYPADPRFTPCGEPTSFIVVRGPSPNGLERRTCRFIFAATLDNLPDQDKADVFGRVTFNAAKDHQLFVEGSFGRNQGIGRVAPTPIREGFGPFNAEKFAFEPVLMPVTSKYYPRELLTKLGYTVPATGMAGIALRAIPAGNRISDNTNTQKRFVFGSTGVLDGWDYDTAINVARAEGLLDYKGYIHEGRFLKALATGNLNPFGPGDATHDALWASAAMEGKMRQSTSTTTAFDFKVNKELMAMAGGNMAMAAGIDLRNEKADDRPLNADYAAGQHIGGEGTVPATKASRNLQAAFVELSLPFAKGWELGLSSRFDKYSDFGSTFNPRANVRFQPTRELVLRTAVGTGFRAPTLWDVNSPPSFGNTADSVEDPQCPDPTELAGRCNTQVPTKSSAAPNLKPEKSRQFSAGVVFEPSKSLTMAVDYYNITKKDTIGVIAADTLLTNPDLLSRFGSRVKRNAQKFILYVETPVDNLGDLKISGVDVDVRGRLNLGEGGRLNLGVAGSYVIKYDAQKYSGGPTGHFAGTGGDSTVAPVPRWQHTATAEWQYSNVSLTLEHVYTRGWLESAASVDANIGVFAPHQVRNSERVNMSVAYKGIKGVTARLGVRNVFDEEPPYVASSSYGSHAAGYAASFTDPRGRFWYGSLSYQFK
ncbi:TonB-dependent receptor [Paucibacter sp. DJ1R-11]|uniref:TonB-dependent receptor n=1 Tax=Paucibacter sp. DJ1R-11 TaxID=2893556 RepID=UPI0021E46FFE|nr:TonB-dependent receptor [Paucibacter sp. DJ1R-11]MCV2362629.1 TonB-dependent receptor [Paucibacter sp. DJ1R-11]